MVVSASTLAEDFLLGSGAICLKPYEELSAPEQGPTIRAQLEGSITLLNIHELGGRPVVVAGTSQGNAGAWDLGCADFQDLAHTAANSILRVQYLATHRAVESLRFTGL